MILRITNSGHLFVRPGDEPDAIINYIMQTGYEEEFVVSDSFEADFVAGLMSAGFLVMSVRLDEEGESEESEEGAADVRGDGDVKEFESEKGAAKIFALLPKHHNSRTVLFFDKLHIARSVKRLLPRYQLRAGADYEKIVQKCVAMHGDEWLTPPLLHCLDAIRTRKDERVRPYSFGLYKNGMLVAGEFGVLCGKVYTSYSGYYEENSCGRVQMILTAEHLRDNGFAFWDLGMPLDYKYTLGACDINMQEFIARFRAARCIGRYHTLPLVR
ncbi:MAG: GNAT family N-acetyltransferase [Spirochaetaceae bacterium]|nr:GNAT family N-acetyltransferase [Spirochaetaceae bacterium]